MTIVVLYSLSEANILCLPSDSYEFAVLLSGHIYSGKGQFISLLDALRLDLQHVPCLGRIQISEKPTRIILYSRRLSLIWCQLKCRDLDSRGGFITTGLLIKGSIG